MSASTRVFRAATLALAMTASAAAQPASPSGNYHIFRATSFATLAKRPAPPPMNMNYYGGPVLSDAKVVSVMWNSDVLQNTQDQIPPFTQALVASTFVDQLGEYRTKYHKAINGHKSTHQLIDRGTYLGQVVLTPRNQSTVLQDSDIQKELEHQIRKGHLPPQDYNTLYMVYFPSNITIEVDGLVSCAVFGGYHSATKTTGWHKPSNIFYAVLPECNSGFDFLTFAASHEFAEAVTDNIPTPLVNPAYPQAWNDETGNEIGDKCSTSGTLTSLAGSWQVTQVWLNKISGCSTTATYTSP
ncbi:MAG: hypothetical protein JO261_07850 [Alphaproteobacteria bacterium]|nr:hypothetical protein [Alphaproteobacteria bacterium]MBV9693597.1 hypothetical protein [Alphaproteobacteria bacterium]